MKNNLNLDNKLFGILLSPSWLSGIIAVCGSLGLVIGTIAMTHFQGSAIQLNYLIYKTNPDSDVTQNVQQGLLSNQFISNLPLIIFWALIGLVVYLFASNIFNAIRDTAELKSELEYANIDRSSLLKTAFLHLFIRAAVLIVWIFYITFFFHKVVPYCVSVTLAGLSQFPSLLGVGYIALTLIVLAFALHIHAVMLRLLLLKPRAFTGALYVD